MEPGHGEPEWLLCCVSSAQFQSIASQSHWLDSQSLPGSSLILVCFASVSSQFPPLLSVPIMWPQLSVAGRFLPKLCLCCLLPPTPVGVPSCSQNATRAVGNVLRTCWPASAPIASLSALPSARENPHPFEAQRRCPHPVAHNFSVPWQKVDLYLILCDT